MLTCLLLFYCVLVILWFIVELNYCCCDINEGRLVGKPELSLELASLAVKPVRYIWETETRCHPWNQPYSGSGVSGSHSQFGPTRTEEYVAEWYIQHRIPWHQWAYYLFGVSPKFYLAKPWIGGQVEWMSIPLVWSYVVIVCLWSNASWFVGLCSLMEFSSGSLVEFI